MTDKITIKHRHTDVVLFEYQPTAEQQASGLAMRTALEADRYLAGPARDPQFFNRRTELYEQRRQREAERLELLHIREAA